MQHTVAEIDQAGVRINKIHITCAIQLENPATNVEGRRALSNYVEPRYLHQTKALLADGRVLQVLDLDRALADQRPEFRHAQRWRVHFHVPVDAERLGPLKTTCADLRTALAAVEGLPNVPHLEVGDLHVGGFAEPPVSRPCGRPHPRTDGHPQPAGGNQQVANLRPPLRRASCQLARERFF